MSAQDQEPSALSRAGDRWTDSENAALIAFLRNGVVLDDIAAALERSPRAISAQLRYFIPDEVDFKGVERELWIREQLADGYDWRAAISAQYRARGRHYFTDAEESILVHAWENRRPLAEMAAQVGASELHVASHLVALGLATNTVHVTEHIEVSEGSAVGVRARLAVDRTASAVWVLVVDGARGTSAARALKLNRHISLHVNHDEALDELDRIIEMHAHRVEQHGPEDGEEVKWSITERTVGEHTIGADQHGSYPPATRRGGGVGSHLAWHVDQT